MLASFFTSVAELAMPFAGVTSKDGCILGWYDREGQLPSIQLEDANIYQAPSARSSWCGTCRLQFQGESLGP